MTTSRQPLRNMIRYVEGKVSAAFSITEAVVIDVDHERKTVQVKYYGDEQPSNYLRIVVPMAEDNCYAGALPAIDDSVLVGFINNDKDSAVVLGSLTDPDKPSPDTSETPWHVERNGVKITFSASGGIITISGTTVNILSDDINFGKTGSFSKGVKYEELKAQFDDLQSKFNAHFHTGNLGAPTTPPLPPNTMSFSNNYDSDSTQLK